MTGIPELGSLIFDADFQNAEDWKNTHRYQNHTQGEAVAADNVPPKFTHFRASQHWHPDGDYNGEDKNPDRVPVAQINGSLGNADDPSGKSLIITDESWGSNGQWGSDVVLTKDLGAEYPELWVEARLKFPKTWEWADQIGVSRGQSILKLMRIRRHSGRTTDNRYRFFGNDGRSGAPVVLMDLKSWSQRGAKNLIRVMTDMRGYTEEDNFGTDADNYIFKDHSKKLEESIRDENGKGKSWAETLMDGGWHKLAFYAKMDSAPGASDGVVEIWYDGQLIDSSYDVPWRRAGDPDFIGWNEASIGGNMHNIPYPESERHQQSYQIDQFKVYHGKPGSTGETEKPELPVEPETGETEKPEKPVEPEIPAKPPVDLPVNPESLFWDAPTSNLDGSDITDGLDYEIGTTTKNGITPVSVIPGVRQSGGRYQTSISGLSLAPGDHLLAVRALPNGDVKRASGWSDPVLFKITQNVPEAPSDLVAE